MDFVIWLVGNIVMELLMYNLGRAAIFVFTFGRVRTRTLREAATGAGYGRLGTHEGRVVVPAGGAQLIGVAVFTLFWLVFYALRR